MKRQGAGFTLIELLVVIAIIGILSAVVLASLNTARTKGNDAGIKANLNSVETQAALYLLNNNSYGAFDNGSGGPAVCPVSGTSGATVFHDATIEKAIAMAVSDAGGGGITACFANGTKYAAAVTRANQASSTYWCVDSTGTRCGVNSYLFVNGACPACASAQ